MLFGVSGLLLFIIIIGINKDYWTPKWRLEVFMID